MSAEDVRALVQHLFEEWNKGKAAAVAVTDELCVADVVWHMSMGKEAHGIEEFKQSFGELYDAFPDTQFTIDDIIVEGDKAAIRSTITFTHTGEFMGRPPTNKKVTLWAIEIYQFAGGKIVEAWSRTDTLGMMQQLGVIPTPKNE